MIKLPFEKGITLATKVMITNNVSIFIGTDQFKIQFNFVQFNLKVEKKTLNPKNWSTIKFHQH